VEVDSDLAALAYELATLIHRIEGEAAAEAFGTVDRWNAGGDRRNLGPARGSRGDTADDRPQIPSIDAAYRVLEDLHKDLRGSRTATIQAVRTLIEETVNTGAPIYNAGLPLGCAFLYLHAAGLVLDLLENTRKDRDERPFQDIRQKLTTAMLPMDDLTNANANANQVAWQLRHAFDAILGTRH
jgi:hypothetical protein